FHPADGRGDHFEIPPRAFCFAKNIFGDPYYVNLGRKGEDRPVFVHYHDGGDLVWVVESLARFLSWPREPDFPPGRVRRHKDRGQIVSQSWDTEPVWSVPPSSPLSHCGKLAARSGARALRAWWR